MDDGHQGEGEGGDDQAGHRLHPDVALHAQADTVEHAHRFFALIVRGEQDDDLARETVARGDQEAEVDQDEDTVLGNVLQAGGERADIGPGVEARQELVERRGHGDADRGRHPHHGGVQLGPVSDQVADEAAGVVDHEIHGQPEQRDRHDQGHGHGGLVREARDAVLEHPRQAVDQHHQEDRQDQRRQDSAHPPDGGAADHDGDHHQGVAHGFQGGLGHSSSLAGRVLTRHRLKRRHCAPIQLRANSRKIGAQSPRRFCS